MSKGGVAGDEDRDGVKSRSHKTLLALVRTLLLQVRRRALSDRILFFFLYIEVKCT